MTTVGINTFVLRQIPESRYSHFDGPIENVAKMAESRLCHEDNVRPGYRDGVMLVEVPPEAFYTSIVPIETVRRFETVFEARQEGEEPVKVTYAYGPKSPAKHVEVVLYSHEVLEEDGDACTDCDYEIVSINASPYEHPVPMGGTTRARNVLHEPGGTDVKLEKKTKDELIFFIREWAEATMFWSRHIQVIPEPEDQ